MKKRQLIDDIRKLNTSAPARFLSQFDEKALAAYLKNLRESQERRNRHAELMREPEIPLRKAQ